MSYGKIGITGSNGFIGKSLRKTFEQENIDFSCFDGDLLDDEDVVNFFKKHKPIIIVHLAGTFNLPFSNLTNKNVLTTEKLLKIGSEYGLQKIVYASTGAVYGEPHNNLSKESDPIMPNTLYGLSKSYAEQVIKFYSVNLGLRHVILRFPNVYGEGNTKGVIGKFRDDIRKENKITIAGDGNQSRNFLHISDAIQAILKAIRYKESNTFNIATNKKITINDVVMELRKKYSFTVNYKNTDNNLRDLLLDTNKAKKLLQFEAKEEKLLV